MPIPSTETHLAKVTIELSSGRTALNVTGLFAGRYKARRAG